MSRSRSHRAPVLSKNAVRDSEEAYLAKVIDSKKRIAEREGRELTGEEIELHVRAQRRDVLSRRIAEWKPELGDCSGMKRFLAYYVDGKGLEIGGGW